MSDLFHWFCDLTREYAKDLTFASPFDTPAAGDPAHASVQRVPEKFDAPSSKERRSLFQPIPAGASEASSLPASNAPSSASQRRKVPDAVNESGRGASIQLSRGIDIQSSAAATEFKECASLIGQPEPEKHALRDLEPPFVTDCEGDADSRALKLSREVMRPAGGQGGQQASNIHLSRGIDIQSSAAQEDQ